jgi:hypothetical protein
LALADQILASGVVSVAGDRDRAVEYDYSRYSLDPWEEDLRRVIGRSEAEAFKPDGHSADGTPYWNYRVERRVKAGPWHPYRESEGK